MYIYTGKCNRPLKREGGQEIVVVPCILSRPVIAIQWNYDSTDT